MQYGTERYLMNVSIRRLTDNDAAYGPWMNFGDERIPQWVYGLVANARAEDDAVAFGVVEQSGSKWQWMYC